MIASLAAALLAVSPWGKAVAEDKTPVTRKPFPGTMNPEKMSQLPEEFEPFPIKKLEEHLGKELSAEQKQAVGEAYKSTVKQVREVEAVFINKVAEISGVPEQRVANLRPAVNSPNHKRFSPAAAFVGRLNTVMDKSMTRSQERQIADAYEDREKALDPLGDQLARDIAKITSVPVSKVRALLPFTRIG